MIKLRDLILDSYSEIVIMDGDFEFISFNPCRIEKLKIITDILECEVERVESEATDNSVRVWLKEDEKWRQIQK